MAVPAEQFNDDRPRQEREREKKDYLARKARTNTYERGVVVDGNVKKRKGRVSIGSRVLISHGFGGGGGSRRRRKRKR